MNVSVDVICMDDKSKAVRYAGNTDRGGRAIDRELAVSQLRKV